MIIPPIPEELARMEKAKSEIYAALPVFVFGSNRRRGALSPTKGLAPLKAKPHITRENGMWKLQFGKKQFHASSLAQYHARITFLLKREWRERETGIIKC